jgi:hypothetical protein
MGKRSSSSSTPSSPAGSGGVLLHLTVVCLLGASGVSSFMIAGAAPVAFASPSGPGFRSCGRSSLSSASTAREGAAAPASSPADDLLSPNYEIEPIAVRIGHGFDIHRMAPIQEAGQPIVIAGVEITHKDQKVRRRLHNPNGQRAGPTVKPSEWFR